ncbi:hypothetical protein G9A89_010930 [Geosiphon pyriformis]|nr:hypothetical protein G9A89_010930 [Geosiphon pyriformis]
MVYLFDIPAFFILFRETLECAVILSVMLGFLDKLLPDPSDASLKKKFQRQIWAGLIAGLSVSLIIGAIFIAVFYTVARNLWEDSEPIWEGIFSLIASIIITIMAFGMLRVKHWKLKWENKLRNATENHLNKQKKGEKWALFILPFTVVCREALESIVFIAGIGFDKPATGLPIPAILGILAGALVGYIIYRGSHNVTLEVFFNIMTTILFFIAAGLFSICSHELHEASTGEDEDIAWELDCCDPDTHQGWGIVKALFGWRNKATIASTVAYFVYWAAVLLGLLFMYLREQKRSINGPNKTLTNEDTNNSFSEKDIKVPV